MRELWDALQLYTRTDPEDQIMRCTHADAGTLPKLFLKITREVFGGKAPVCLSTFRSIVLDNLRAEELNLLGIAVDHNKAKREPI